MNFSSNDNTPILVAPRPVRLTAPFNFLTRAQPVRIVSEPAKDVTERSHSAEELKIGLCTDSSTDSSPRSSPRSVFFFVPLFGLSDPTSLSRAALPSEALEEFLSILRPSIFPPRSPVRNRRHVSLPLLHHEHSIAYKGRRVEPTVEEVESTRSAQPSRNSGSPAEIMDGMAAEIQLLGLEDTPFRWFTSNVLSSPVSRNNTRNPFQRHHTYPVVSSPHAFSPSPLPSLSPAAIPLPLPSPDELTCA
ncbi:hypothetical protein GYMLUDRAFT_162545 [Collybiopsis luxurians FD-317 M1]|uniref:Uncharacterized protein n=1 Tax=Collybiopsis luxurians FD-317 M1 TaxID=944289 RepID=A0A0D0BHY7_9AGAR|nr:hypothetical protein GYMLUDRAFT_162545 [Collybiopsis luxurians FD-317 M1]